MRPPEPEDLEAFSRHVVALLDEQGIAYAIGGSLAAMEYSEPRLSIDVDLMVVVEPEQVAGLVVSVERWGVYVTPLDVILSVMLPRGRPFHVIDGASGSKADIYPIRETGITGSAMKRRRERVWDHKTGATAWFLAPEDVILLKLRHYRAGGEVARKHPEDIAKILEVMAPDLDIAYIERWSRELGVDDLWQVLWRLGGA